MTNRRSDEANVARALQESEDRYRFLTETIPVHVWTASPDGKLDYVSEQTAAFFGVTKEELLAHGWQNVVHPEDLPLAVERWGYALTTGTTYEIEFRLRSARGDYEWHLARAVPQQGPEGGVVRWFGTNVNVEHKRRVDAERSLLLEQEQRARRDADLARAELEALLAERTRLLAAAEEARKKADFASGAKDEFLHTASHELRTPLNAILGWARLLRSGTLDTASFARGLDAIERNANAQVQLIEDILDGSRIITGSLHLDIRPTDLPVVVDAAIDVVRPAAAAKNIALDVRIDPDAAHIHADPDRLQQIVWNLVTNAVKFTPNGGHVAIRAKTAGPFVEISVKDDGQGIASEFLPHVFERFRQADASRTRRHGGLGLGLALVHHLIEGHGGSVRAESSGEGKGATFTVTLPIHASVPPASRAARPPMKDVTPMLRPNSLVGVSVLVVDDEVDARELVGTLLHAHGADVMTAGSAAQAIELVEKQVPTLIVSDIGMPAMDGYALIDRVRLLSRASKIPAIALTAYAREEDRRRALQGGFQAYLPKPVEPDALVRMVGDVARTGTVGSS